MAYSYEGSLQAKSGSAGLTLAGSLRNRDGTAYASQPTFSFVDHGNGFYSFYTDGMPEGFRGQVRVTAAGTTEGIVEVSPTASEAGASLARLLGLVQENWVLRSPAFDADGNLETATVRLYDSAANAETDDGSSGLVAVYAIENTYTDGVLTKSTQTRVS
jgi:hypothetical protein